MTRTKKLALVLIVVASLLFLACYCAFHYSEPDVYPWEYLRDRHAREWRQETRIQARLKRLVGLDRNGVLATLGQPDRIEQQRIPTVPFFGPQQTLLVILRPGQAFEEWQYSKGVFTYLVWFAGGTEGAFGLQEWKVVATGLNREGRAY